MPPTGKALISEKNTSAARARNETVEAIRKIGMREWKKRSGYHQQERVESAFYRHEKMIGGRPRRRIDAAQATEVGLAINVLNRMLELGAARSEAVLDRASIGQGHHVPRNRATALPFRLSERDWPTRRATTVRKRPGTRSRAGNRLRAPAEDHGETGSSGRGSRRSG